MRLDVPVPEFVASSVNRDLRTRVNVDSERGTRLDLEQPADHKGAVPEELRFDRLPARVRLHVLQRLAPERSSGHLRRLRRHAAPPDYELSSHTRGIAAEYSQQFSDSNLVNVQASYVTASTLRDNNTQMINPVRAARTRGRRQRRLSVRAASATTGRRVGDL